MRKILTVLLFLAVLLIGSTTLWADNYTIIVEIAQGADIRAIADALHAKVLDQLSSGPTPSYLLEVSSLSPTANLTTGVIRIDLNPNASVGRLKGGILSIPDRTSPDWYANQPAFVLIHANEAKSVAGGGGVVIADLNSLVDYSHPALRGHLTGGYDFQLDRATSGVLDQSAATFLDQSSATFLDQSAATFLDQSAATFLDQSSATFLDQSSATFLDATNPAHGHGTMVAGILAVLAPKSMIMPLRVFNDQGQADAFVIAKAIRYAVDHGADVINMSFGISENTKVLHDAIEYADKSGAVLVASAGNENTDRPQFPAASDKVIGVGATNLLDLRASFSNYGGSVRVAAPGVSIITPYPGGHYAVVSGTSFSAPIVAAEAALIRSIQAKKVDARDLIGKGLINIDHRNPDRKPGKGRVDLVLGVTVH